LDPEVLSRKPCTKESDVYSFGIIIMWKHTMGRKGTISEFKSLMMKRYWDHNPENRPTTRNPKSLIILCSYK